MYIHYHWSEENVRNLKNFIIPKAAKCAQQTLFLVLFLTFLLKSPFTNHPPTFLPHHYHYRNNETPIIHLIFLWYPIQTFSFNFDLFFSLFLLVLINFTLLDKIELFSFFFSYFSSFFTHGNNIKNPLWEKRCIWKLRAIEDDEKR